MLQSFKSVSDTITAICDVFLSSSGLGESGAPESLLRLSMGIATLTSEVMTIFVSGAGGL